ncbi:MAG: hypothetical protein KAH13_04165 [Tenericutes bacterium]|nr:hypothetical protein [Mycoplasmatota bacterium]
MKIKRIIMVVFLSLLSLSMMGCPEIENSPPEIVQIIDGEILSVNEIIYEHVKGTEFHPDTMLLNLIENQNLAAIDYNQKKLIIGQDRTYIDISSDVAVTSFYDLWEDGEDANLDGVVNDDDIELYGSPKTDQSGNLLYDEDKIFIVEVLLGVGAEINFTLTVADEEGALTELLGQILIIE